MKISVCLLVKANKQKQKPAILIWKSDQSTNFYLFALQSFRIIASLNNLGLAGP